MSTKKDLTCMNCSLLNDQSTVKIKSIYIIVNIVSSHHQRKKGRLIVKGNLHSVKIVLFTAYHKPDLS